MANFGAILGKITPWITAAATSNVPALVGLAAKAIGGAVGQSVSPNLQAITEAVAGATPEQLASIKAADQNFQLQMQTLGFQTAEEMLKLDDDDRANARAREITLKDRLPAILAISVTTGFFGLLWILAKWNIPAGNSSIMFGAVGTLGTSWVAIIGYYFGSSAGSDAKTKIIGDIAKQ
jgi:hypothetical protein